MRVLIPSVYEINECSDKNLAFEEVTRGRKVIAVEFTISSKDSIESLRLKSDIEKKLDIDQMTLYDILEEKKLI